MAAKRFSPFGIGHKRCKSSFPEAISSTAVSSLYRSCCGWLVSLQKRGWSGCRLLTCRPGRFARMQNSLSSVPGWVWLPSFSPGENCRWILRLDSWRPTLKWLRSTDCVAFPGAGSSSRCCRHWGRGWGFSRALQRHAALRLGLSGTCAVMEGRFAWSRGAVWPNPEPPTRCHRPSPFEEARLGRGCEVDVCGRRLCCIKPQDQ